jgi:hypothetical protein
MAARRRHAARTLQQLRRASAQCAAASAAAIPDAPAPVKRLSPKLYAEVRSRIGKDAPQRQKYRRKQPSSPHQLPQFLRRNSGGADADGKTDSLTIPIGPVEIPSHQPKRCHSARSASPPRVPRGESRRRNGGHLAPVFLREARLTVNPLQSTYAAKHLKNTASIQTAPIAARGRKSPARMCCCHRRYQAGRIACD